MLYLCGFKLNHMKRVLLVALFLFAFIFSNAQDCFWIKGATPGGSSGMNQEVGKGIATDASGNVYVIGDFDGTSIKLGAATLNNTNTSNYGGVFLAKMNPKGNFLWAKGSQNGQNNSVATDKLGHVYVTGNYVQSMAFGTTTLTAVSGGIFLAKYDSSGNFLWARDAGGITSGVYDESKSVAVDNSGNPIITGNFYNPTITFDTYTLTNSSVGSNVPDYFVAKYDPSGNVLWAQSAIGKQNDMGLSVTADNSNNIYALGTSRDSTKFGNVTIYGPTNGGAFPFLTKYDSLGNVIYSKVLFNGAGFPSVTLRIKADPNYNLFISGSTGGETIFGNDTINKGNPGYMAAFIAKYDTAGVPIWGKGGSTNPLLDEYCMGSTYDANGNVYMTGWFLGSTMTFGSDVLTNPINNQPTIFISKFDANGNNVWARTSNSAPSLARGKDMAAGLGENVYFTGNFTGNTLNLGTSALSLIQGTDLFIADVFSFTSSITSYTNATCNGAANGTAVSIASGGNLPYSYSWNSTPVQTNDTAFNLPAGSYQVAVTEGYGCTLYSSVTITEPAPDSLHLCMVTVDSASQYNILSWDKTSFTDIDSFIIYREIATNNYQPIASVPYDSLSMFIDTVRTMYFPNTGDPNAGTYRYKLRGHLVCGGYTGLSPFHNTIYFLNNNGTFYWVQPYTIQGSPNPVSSYILLRDDNSTGNFQPVASVAGTQQLVSDPLYSIYQNTATWRVQTQWNITCTPTAKQQNGAQAFSSSYSNTYTNIGIGIKNNFESTISIYPSPNHGSFTIETGALKNAHMEMYNLLGGLVLNSQLSTEKNQINTEGLSKGTYIVHITSDAGRTIKKVIIE